MGKEWLQRTELLVGEEHLRRLQSAHVLVVGLGGVGAYAAENLCRAGIGELTLVDADIVEDSNRNRQLLALTTTLGRPKSEVMAERLRQINPEVKLHIVQEFIRDERMVELLKQADYDYVVDAIDSLSPKVFLIFHAINMGLKIVSAMGAGGKMDPTAVRVVDIQDTFRCKLAQHVRKRLHRIGIRSGFKAVFSPEPVHEGCLERSSTPEINRSSTVGTISYMPAVFGCVAASVVIRDVCEEY